MYQQVRDFRNAKEQDPGLLHQVAEQLNLNYPHDWLLRLEIVELLNSYKWLPELEADLRNELQQLQTSNNELNSLIQRGLQII